MEEEIPRSERPHHATVTMKIDVREMTQSGDILHSVIGDNVKLGMNCCLKQLKECLERLNG